MARYRVTFHSGHTIIVYADDTKGAKQAALWRAPSIAGKRIVKAEKEGTE